MSEKSDQLRAQILSLTAEFFSEEFPEKKFIPGESSVPVAGRVFDSADVQSLIDSSLDFWLTEGRFARQFEVMLGGFARGWFVGGGDFDGCLRFVVKIRN